MGVWTYKMFYTLFEHSLLSTYKTILFCLHFLLSALMQLQLYYDILYISNPIWAYNSYFKRNFTIFLISLNLSKFDWSSRGQILVRACQMILDVEFGCNEMEIGGWRMFWVCLTVDQVCQSNLNMDNFWILSFKPSNWCVQHSRNFIE